MMSDFGQPMSSICLEVPNLHQIRMSRPGDSDVQMLQFKVGVVGVCKDDEACQRESLGSLVCECVSQTQ